MKKKVVKRKSKKKATKKKVVKHEIIGNKKQKYDTILELMLKVFTIIAILCLLYLIAISGGWGRGYDQVRYDPLWNYQINRDKNSHGK